MSGLLVCGSCFGLRGELHLRRQLCSCATKEEYDALAEARFARDGTYWTRVAELCRCCGAELVDARHKFALWFCRACFSRARAVNVACGRCAIPVGWHSIVNAVFINSERAKSRSGASVEADQLNAFFRETGTVWDWGQNVVERQWQRAGLAAGHDVSVNAYLKAVRGQQVDKASWFKELAGARGVPSSYWPK